MLKFYRDELESTQFFIMDMQENLHSARDNIIVGNLLFLTMIQKHIVCAL